MKNHGVILGQRNTDYVAGVLPYEERNPSGNWTQYLPTEEKQYFPGFDTMACVTFSALNSIETQYKFLTGKEINLSDRFTATMSGTTSLGNYLWKVVDSIRKDGVVLEGDWPVLPNMDWNGYYLVPTIEVINKAKEFLRTWEIKYEFIDWSKESLMYHLKHAPIQVVIPGHAVLEFINNEQVEKYFDTYEPYIKDRIQPIGSALKIILTKKTMTEQVVKQLQALEGYSDPAGVQFWTGKSVEEYLKARLADKIKTIQEAQ